MGHNGARTGLRREWLHAQRLGVARAGREVAAEAAQVAPLGQVLLAHLGQLEQARVGQLPRHKLWVPLAAGVGLPRVSSGSW